MLKRRFKNILLIFGILFVLMPSFLVSAEEPVGTEDFQSEKLKPNVIYFYSKTCSHCKRIAPFVDRIKKEYKDQVSFQKYEINENQKSRKLFTNFLDAYGVPTGQGFVPVIFIGDVLIGGDIDIENDLESKINEAILNDWKLKNNLDDVVGGLKPVKDSSRSKISIPLVIGAAFIDSINPCAIAVLLFLVAFLLAIQATKKRMLLVGGVYVLTVMLVYIVAGFGLLRFIGYFDISREINYVAAGVLIFAGLVSLKDYWWPDKGISLKIPDRIKPKIEKYLTKATIPSVIVAGILVAAFELPCTGEVYLGILSLMSDSSTVSAIFYLVLYNIIFVLPLVVILILASCGLNIEKIERIRSERRKWLKLLLGLGMLILAVWLLL